MKKQQQVLAEISQLSKSDAERIRIIDYLFSSKNVVTVTSASMLREMVNERVHEAKPVDSDIAFRKLITIIRKKAALDGVTLSSPHHLNSLKGYRYSLSGYSAFEEENEAEQAEQELLRFSASLFNKFKGSDLYEELQDIVSKILSESGKEVTSLDKRTEKVLQVQSGTREDGVRWIKPIMNAILRRKALMMIYEGYGKEVKEKRVCPYVLKEYMGRWYMVAYDYSSDRTNKTSVFSLNCINDLLPTKAPYYQDPEFNPEQYFKYSLGVFHKHQVNPIKVRLEFEDESDKDRVRNEPIHPTQTIVSSGLREPLVVQIEVYETPELFHMLLGLGKRVKVISPLRVVNELKKELEAVLKQYK